MRFTATEAKILQESSDTRTFRFALALGMLSALLTGVLGLFGAVLSLPFVPYLIIVGILVTGFIIGAILLWGFRSGRVVERLVKLAEAAVKAETQLKNPAPPAPATSTLPAAVESPINAKLASGRAVEIARDTIRGFEPDDLLWLFKYLAAGNAFTEKAMENMPLPVSGQRMGKAQPGTLYQLFVDACLETGIIVDRGGRGNKMGTLAVTDPNEMMRRFKQPSQ